MRIRDATVSDIPAITEIYGESVRNGVATYEISPPDLSEMADRFNALNAKSFPYIVAETDDGTVLGYAYASSFRTRPAYNWLVEDSIYLAPDARGKGLGKALLSELLCRCERLGFRQMTAVIGGASPASIAVHHSAGFKMIGVMTGTGYKHGQWLDTAIMQIALGDGNRTDPVPEAFPGKLYS